MLHVVPVGPLFPDEMPAVACGVDEEVFGLAFHAALDDGLEILVLHLVLLEGQVVQEENEPIPAVLDHRDKLRKHLELVLVELNHPKAVVAIVVDECLDAGGLAGAAVPVEQHVVRASTFDERLRILPEQLLLPLVSDKRGEPLGVEIHHRQQFHRPVSGLSDAERLVEGECADAALLVEIGHHHEERPLRCALFEFGAEPLDHPADFAVVCTLPLGDRAVVSKYGEAVDSQILLDFREVEEKDALHCLEVIEGEEVDACFGGGSHPFAGERKGVFVGGQQICDVVVPEILVEPAFRRQVQKPFHLPEDSLHEQWLRAGVRLPVGVDFRQGGEDRAPLGEIAVEQEM